VIAKLVIDASALRANVAALRAVATPSRFAAVVKANAYGHGLATVGRALAESVDGFCVYRVEEALALRTGGVTKPVLVLGPIEPRDLELAHASRLSITLWDDGAFRTMLRDVARRSGRPFAVHAKIDTGTTRLGIRARDAGAAIASYLGDRDLDVRGIYTHLAAAEELERAFTLEQLARYDDVLAPFEREIRERGIRRHAAASAAAMLFPQARYDIVRAGIATYGIWPSERTRAAAPELALEPALTWSTELAVVHAVDAGTSVGYGCTFVTERASTIGVLPIGYSEGLPRAASGRAEVLVRGRRAPIVGRVCMNMAFVDLTRIPEARAGSTVTLIGRDGDEQIDANEWGAWCDSIGYEIVARLPAGIPRTMVESPRPPLAGAPRRAASARA